MLEMCNLNCSFCYVKDDDIKYIKASKINYQLLICKCLQLVIDIFHKTKKELICNKIKLKMMKIGHTNFR